VLARRTAVLDRAASEIAGLDTAEQDIAAADIAVAGIAEQALVPLGAGDNVRRVAATTAAGPQE